jgi:hypothetical protein
LKHYHPERNHQGQDNLLPFPIPASLPPASLAIRCHQRRAFAESALRIKKIPQQRLLSYPAGLALSLKDRFTAAAIPQWPIKATSERRLNCRFDIFWERLQSGRPSSLFGRARCCNGISAPQ